MFQKRFILWIMLFTGVVIHMLSSSNMNIAITAMVNSNVPSKANNSFVPICQINSTETINVEMKPKVREFNWDPNQKHTLLSSWAWFMGLAQLLGGILCQKYGGKVIFGYSNLLIGIINFLIPTAANIGINFLIALRALQGMAGGVGIGNAINFFMSRWVPPHERGKFAATMSGLFFGAAFSYFMNGFIEYFLGWRFIFYTTGVISLVWSFAWYCIVYDSPKEHPSISSDELTLIQSSIGNHLAEKKLSVPWLAILTSVPLYVNTLCYFTATWTTMTFMIYTPLYLTNVFGFSSYKMGELSSTPYLMQGAFSIILAMITDNILKRKLMSTTNTRKLATFLNAVLGGTLVGCLVLGRCNSVIILMLLNFSIMVCGATLSGIVPNVVDLSPNFCTVIHGFQGLIASMSGILSPALVNYMTEPNKYDPAGWNKVFLITSAMSITCGTLFLIFGDSRVQWWNSEREKNKEVNVTLLKQDEKLVKIEPKNAHV